MALDYKKKSDYWDQKRKDATTPRPSRVRSDRRRIEVSTSVPKEILAGEDGEQVDLQPNATVTGHIDKPERHRIEIKRRNTRPAPARRREEFEVVPDAPEVELEVDPIRARERRKVAQKRTERQKRVQRSNLRTVVSILVVGILLALALGSLVAFLRSPFFAIREYNVTGTRYLTSSNVLSYVKTDERTSILPLDTDAIVEALLANPWIASATVTKHLPSTLEIAITERTPVAIVSMVNAERWLIASDGVWLGKVSTADGVEQAFDPSGAHPPVALDKDRLVSIEDITPAENTFGTLSQSAEVINAIEVIEGLEPALLAQVEIISAPEISLTKLITTDHIEILFGNSRDAREKSKIALELLRLHADKITLINVRSIDKPTWRGLDTDPEQPR